ncbi:hypothetical protein [Neobacillus niacini]|uniref:hypothetical protein n=1 Tax=Neobacillus niacini TaxID=86668 RepID=UPI0039835EC9
MKIYEFYRGSANITLNGSIAALVPAILISLGNLYYFQDNEIMLLTIPFVVYSFINFQLYLFRIKQSISIERKMTQNLNDYQHIFQTKNLVVVFMNHQQPCVHLYFPNGHQAGMIKKYRQKGHFPFRKPILYALYNQHEQAVGFYKIKQLKTLVIEVYDQNMKFVGCYEKEKLSWFKSKKEMMDENGRFIGTVEGAAYYMDECVYNPSREQVGRLRRGWMPFEWSDRFPEPNTPVLSLSENLSEKDKLLRMSFLVNEYFIER